MLVFSKGKLMGLTEQNDVHLCFLTPITHQIGLQLHIYLGKDNEETVSRKQRACCKSKISPCCSPAISLQAIQSAEHKTMVYCSRCIQILQQEQKNTQLLKRWQNNFVFLFSWEINLPTATVCQIFNRKAYSSIEFFVPSKPDRLNCLWEAIFIHLDEDFIYQMSSLEIAD